MKLYVLRHHVPHGRDWYVDQNHQPTSDINKALKFKTSEHAYQYRNQRSMFQLYEVTDHDFDFDFENETSFWKEQL